MREIVKQPSEGFGFGIFHQNVFEAFNFEFSRYTQLSDTTKIKNTVEKKMLYKIQSSYNRRSKLYVLYL